MAIDKMRIWAAVLMVSLAIFRISSENFRVSETPTWGANQIAARK
jgi:hypothetical protein